jgi:transcription elongation factor GreB
VTNPLSSKPPLLMSRAFVKERDGDADDDRLPERPRSAEPNYVTEAGLRELKRRLAEAEAERERLESDGASKSALARSTRAIKHLELRVESAIVSAQTTDEIGLGARVTIDDGGKRMTYTIVGEDQADPANGLISWTSPLGRALVGRKRGDNVTWHRPLGDVDVTVVDFA